LRDRLAEDQLPSIATIARILKRNGLIEAPSPKPKWPAVGRFEHPHPNDLWQMDLKAPVRLPDRRKIYPVGLLDDHSRYLLGLWMTPDFSDDGVINCWIEACRQHGLPKRTLTDHGPQFRMEDDATSAFRVMLWACGVGHTQGRIAHPQTQGKIERFWRTLKTEVLSLHEYRDRRSWQSRFDEWRYQYNHIRPHQELGDEPPISRYRSSERPFREPDPRQRIGLPGSIYRRVGLRGRISLGGQLLMIGRGLAGWTIEARPLGTGCWHVYFRHHFVREILLTKPIRDQRTRP
jgi:transposase InsO family protein